MKLNLLFTTKNIVLILIGLFYLLIFSHNILGDIFEGYDSLPTDPVSASDSNTTVKNKLDLQNAVDQSNNAQASNSSANTSQTAGSTTATPPPIPIPPDNSETNVPATSPAPTDGSAPAPTDGSSPAPAPTDGSTTLQGFQNWN
jgi:hypothetical protein